MSHKLSLADRNVLQAFSGPDDDPVDLLKVYCFTSAVTLCDYQFIIHQVTDTLLLGYPEVTLLPAKSGFRWVDWKSPIINGWSVKERAR